MIRPMKTGLLILLLIQVTLPAAALLPFGDDDEGTPSLAPMLERTAPAVVNISTYSTLRYENPLYSDPFFRRFFRLPEPRARRQSRSAGSGVIIDAGRGHVVTNHHVVASADAIEVTLQDGRTLQAELLGSDEQVDLALLKIKARKLAALTLGTEDRLRVGDFVVAIGNPFGLGQTVTSGIVSALGRSGLGILGYEDFIQTDASINPGNSGGALVNLSGELVGINSAIIAPSGGNVGIGFAIPASIVEQVSRQLAEYGEVRRGGLGVAFQDLNDELAEAFGLMDAEGVLITQVLREGPADRAGLKPGDVIVSIDGRPVGNGSSLRNRMGLMMLGQRLRVVYYREGIRRQAMVEVAAVEAQEIGGDALSDTLRGVTLRDYIQDGQSVAVEVSEIDRRSLAWQHGLRPGDLIVAANRFRVTSTRELQAAQAEGTSLILQIQRGRATYFLTLR